jgi:AP-1 complex subunit beta-1
MEKKKEAVKKVIAAMTVGKDVSMLFTDVVNCIQTQNIELKKLVYLYLINYAKSQPDLAILAVNTFVKDTMDPNPLIRALAVRTMGCIRVDKIVEYLCDPLRKCLKVPGAPRALPFPAASDFTLPRRTRTLTCARQRRCAWPSSSTSMASS